MRKPLPYYEVHGRQGPFMLMVHGLMSSRVQWMKNIDALSAFCRPVIIELLGHGRSPSPDDPKRYYPTSYVAEFEKIRQTLNVDQWFVCGQSLGASLTLRYSLMYPEHIIAQIFTNSRSAFSEAGKMERTSGLLQYLKEEGRKGLAQLPVHPAKSRYLEPEVKKALIKDIDLIDIKGFSHTLQYMSPKSSVRNVIDENQVPTLMVVGKYDKPFLPFRDFANKHIPNLEEVVFDGGHAVNIDAADEFNFAVEAFIKRHVSIKDSEHKRQ